MKEKLIKTLKNYNINIDIINSNKIENYSYFDLKLIRQNNNKRY